MTESTLRIDSTSSFFEQLPLVEREREQSTGVLRVVAPTMVELGLPLGGGYLNA